MAQASKSKLSGPQKAALFILGLDEAAATDILKFFDEKDMGRLAEHVSKLKEPPIAELDSTFTEFVAKMASHQVPRDGNAYVRRLAVAAIGEEKASRLLAAPPLPPALETLKNARATTLAELLADEHPQIAAVVLAQLPREQAAKVILAMPPNRQEEVMARVAMLEEVPAAAAQLASETLAKALTGDVGGATNKFDGIGFVAGLLNEIAPTDSERLLGALELADASIVPRVREKMFTFEDLLRLPARAIQMLMKEVTSESLLVALKTASEPLREHFLSALSSRAGAQLREDLQMLPPTRLSDVERAQREIVESAMRLGAEGRITMPGPNAETLV
jgi:flagellar motor switch protein FliG